MNDAKKSAIAKLAKMGLTEEEVLSLFVDDEEETIVEENGDSSEYEESKSWQQIVMEEHVGYYNKRYNVNLTFDEYYEGVTSGKLEVHYNWKQMLGLEEQTPFPIDPSKDIKTEKFKKNGN
jgi:hypothetical protein|tara:strand:- start:1033 stop:1395 length:363 start_codon:yes stop_codon:yes gene_type:complete